MWNNGNSDGLYSWAPKSLQVVAAAMKLKGRKVMTNLDTILKSRDVPLPTKVWLIKAMLFPVVTYRCESWTIKKVKSLGRVQLFATLWTVAYQAPPSMGFSRQEYWSGLPFLLTGDLLNPGIKPGSPTLSADTLPSKPPGKPRRKLDHKKSWAPKDWCFWTVLLEKTLESPLNCKEIQPVHPEGNQSWIFIGSIDVEAETPILWPPDVKNWLIGKDPDAGKD